MKLFITKIPGFLREALSEGGTASIKRVTLAILLLAFLAECVYNICTGKMLENTLRDQLYYAFISVLAAILGINVLNGIKDIKIEQSKNNAAVGSPSPTPDTTVITDKIPGA